MLRGLAIVVMVSNHLTARSYINYVSQGRIYASAAEAFVLLSGFVLGMVSLGRASKHGFADAASKLVARAFTLYKASVALMLVALVVTAIHPGYAKPVFDSLPAALDRTLLAALTLRLEPRLVDVLQLYVVCLALSPAVLWMLQRKLWAPVMAGSIGLWLLHQLHPYALCIQPLGREHPYFAFPSWQLVYFTGFVVGYHKSAFAAVASRIPQWLVVLVALPILAGSLVASYYDGQLGIWPHRVLDRARWITLTDRSSVGFVRLVTVAALFPFAWVLLDRCWQPFNRLLGTVLVQLGQQSLYVFILHIPWVVLWHAANLPAQSALVATLGQLTILTILWLCVRYKILFGIIPR